MRVGSLLILEAGGAAPDLVHHEHRAVQGKGLDEGRSKTPVEDEWALLELGTKKRKEERDTMKTTHTDEK